MSETIFSVLGPVMIGPSSSHTAGVARLGKIARNILKGNPQKAEIEFMGSLASTFRGHGSDLAVIGGLLGMDSSDTRIPKSFELAEASGLTFSFRTRERVKGHPNTLKISVSSTEDLIEMIGSSRGGGNILVEKINGFDVNFRGVYPSIWILHYDRPGMVGWAASLLAKEEINIAEMSLKRSQPRGFASLILQCDSQVPAHIIEKMGERENVKSCRYIPPVR